MGREEKDVDEEVRPDSGVEESEDAKSVALLCRLLLPMVVRLNICGTRARESEDGIEPSGGCSVWYCSNSTSSALRALRYSVGVWELRSRMVGREKPRRR